MWPSHKEIEGRWAFTTFDLTPQPFGRRTTKRFAKKSAKTSFFASRIEEALMHPWKRFYCKLFQDPDNQKPNPNAFCPSHVNTSRKTKLVFYLWRYRYFLQCIKRTISGRKTCAGKKTSLNVIPISHSGKRVFRFFGFFPARALYRPRKEGWGLP